MAADPITPDRVRLFSLADEYRRATLWGIGGCLLIAVVGWIVNAPVNPRPLIDKIVFMAAFCSLAVWLSQYLLPRLRVDSAGISRRILWWWDLWPWEAFSAGQIRHGITLQSYVDSSRPWYRRRLHLGYLQKEDAQRLDALIRRVWTLPPAPIVPDTLKFRFNWRDRRELQLTPEGISVFRKGGRNEYGWDQVQTVEIWRLESDRRDFCELRLELPDRKLKLRVWLHQGQECLNWTGASAEVISAVFSRHVVPPRLRDFSLHGEPRSLDELDARQAREDAHSKEQLRGTIWCIRLTWGMTAAMLLLFPWPRSLGMVAIFGLTAWMGHWIYNDSKRKIEARRAEFDAQRIALTLHQD
jgi:hypothetical protein